MDGRLDFRQQNNHQERLRHCRPGFYHRFRCTQLGSAAVVNHRHRRYRRTQLGRGNDPPHDHDRRALCHCCRPVADFRFGSRLYFQAKCYFANCRQPNLCSPRSSSCWNLLLVYPELGFLWVCTVQWWYRLCPTPRFNSGYSTNGQYEYIRGGNIWW